MMKSKWIILLLLAIDIAIAAAEWKIYADKWKHEGALMLRFYTNSSNVLAMFACAVCAVTGAVCLISGLDIPRWAQTLRYIAACCLMVTFIIAACVLVPLDAGNTFKGFMLTGDNLYVHTLCPLLLLASCLISGGEPLSVKHAAIAVVPTVIYGVITLIMVGKRIYNAPYFFFRIHSQPWYTTVMWMTIIVGGNFAVSWLLTILRNLLHRTA